MSGEVHEPVMQEYELLYLTENNAGLRLRVWGYL